MIKLTTLLIGLLGAQQLFALALGDTVSSKVLTNQHLQQKSATQKYQVIEDSNLKLSTQYYINNQKQVFAIKWIGENPQDLKQVLGSYYPEYQAAYTKRSNSLNHRVLHIETNNLVVEQFGLSGRGFQGVSYVKSLQPPATNMRQILAK